MPKKILALVFTAALFIHAKPAEQFKEGDILFQSSNSSQAKAIELATHSQFSHVGIILQRDGKLQVLEAVQPVKFTPVADWIKRGNNSRYVQMRLKDKNLSAEVLRKMRASGDKMVGKDYDLYFEWSDDKLYCSELVWKIYKQGAGIEVGKLKKFKDYDFSHELVKKELQKRYGNNLPMNETIVAPEDIYKSNNLLKVR